MRPPERREKDAAAVVVTSVPAPVPDASKDVSIESNVVTISVVAPDGNKSGVTGVAVNISFDCSPSPPKPTCKEWSQRSVSAEGIEVRSESSS